MMKSTTVIRKPKKKMGRPPIGKKPSGVFPIRLPEETIAAVDAFADREGIKTRSEAVRQLLDQALATKRKGK